MKIVTRKVYYCEFCKKHGLTSNSIKEHEQHCTANPNRECRMCYDGPLSFDIQVKEDYNRDGSVSWTEKAINIKGDECPACILAFVRQNKVTNIILSRDKNGGWDSWNYKEAVNKWWQNNPRDEREYSL